MKEIPVIVVTGPTASGKTAFAVRLAEVLSGEIISVDSRQIFRGMDLGTGKDLSEYTLPSGKVIAAHLIDIADPDYPYNLAEFMRDCHKAIREIASRGKQTILCGGTALYLDSILRSYTLQGGAPDPEERERKRSLPTEELQKLLYRLEPESPILKNEPENRTRIIRRIELLQGIPDQALLDRANSPQEDLSYKFLVLGTLRSRQELHSRIEKRLYERLDQGMLEEAKRLHKQGVTYERMEFFGLEYRYMALHLQGKLSLQEMCETLLAKIRQFAKRQDSWFRNMERNGIDIYWYPPEDTLPALELVQKFLSGKELEKPSFRLCETFYGKVCDRK